MPGTVKTGSTDGKVSISSKYLHTLLVVKRFAQATPLDGDRTFFSFFLFLNLNVHLKLGLPFSGGNLTDLNG